MTYEGWTVMCPDGHQHHAGRFETYEEAYTWADYGHFCLSVSQHQIIHNS